MRMRLLSVTAAMVASGSTVSAQSPATRPSSTWEIGTPISTYWAGPGYGGQPLTDADARQLDEGGFNLVWSPEKDLDVAGRYKLRALLNDPLITPGTLDTPAGREKLDALIARVKAHPSLYAYFITDEPNAAAFPALGKLVGYLRERDPAHMAYINLFPTYANNDQLGTKGDTVTAYKEHLRQYVEIVTPALISWDHYQFVAGGKDSDQYFLNLALIRKAAMDARLPFLNIVQACTWDPSMRAPTPDELRYLVYTTLAYGAQGISYFVYSYEPCYKPGTGQLVTPQGKRTELYEAAKKLNPEFVAIASELQKLQSLGTYHAGMLPPGAEPLPDGLPFRFDPPVAKMDDKPPQRVKGLLVGVFGRFRRDARHVHESEAHASHVMVVNLDYREPAVTRLVGQEPLEVFDAASKTWKSAGKDGKAELRLPPGGGVLARTQ